MPAVHRALHQLHTGVQLCRFPLIIVETQPRVAADLPEPRQFGEHFDLVFVKLALPLLCQHLPHMHYLRIVHCLLCLVKPHIAHFLELFGKVFEDIRLQAAHDEGSHHSLESRHGFAVVMLRDRHLDLLSEYLITVQKSRHQIIKDTPQLTQPVLDRRARQRDPHLAVDDLDCLCRRCRVVLDILRLVDHLVRELPAFIIGYIPSKQIVGGDAHVIVRAVLDLFLPLLLVACDELHLQFRSEPLKLLAPVVHERRR